MLTIVTAWYQLKNKFNYETYYRWIANFLDNAKCNIVIYTNAESCHVFEKYKMLKNIHLVIKELADFRSYKYREEWIRNHENNYLLKDRTCWQLNMLWSEKISFVKLATENNYFDNAWYAWCDIGYFRGRLNDSQNNILHTWPCADKITALNHDKIYYGKICDDNLMINLQKYLEYRNSDDLPIKEIPPDICSVAGGFFIVHNTKIGWWYDIYYKQLGLYFKYKYLVKDDQIILIDCIAKYIDNFILCEEHDYRYDNWFMFQRIL